MHGKELLWLLAAVGAILVFRVAKEMFSTWIKVGAPGVIAGCVALLVFVGMGNLDEGTANALLLPYAALGLALILAGILAVVLRLLGPWVRSRSRQPNLLPPPPSSALTVGPTRAKGRGQTVGTAPGSPPTRKQAVPSPPRKPASGWQGYRHPLP